MSKRRMVRYKKYVKRDTIPPEINTINKKRIPIRVDRGVFA